MAIRRISHFEIEEPLGEGAMGKVYRARDTHLDRPVAIKLLADRTLGDPTFLERFQREAKLAAQLNHPHIATIYAFGKEGQGEAYIAMELVEGETLAEVISRGPLPVALARKYGRHAASALVAAHSRGILHRDIKPANLMITPEGDLKVMDFGVARRSGDTQITMAGALVGTANIMAPEIIRGNEAGPAADLFSLGCVLYECLAGRAAFEGDDTMAVLYQVMNTEPVSLEEIRTEVPPYFRDLVRGLLQKDPRQRLGPAARVEEILVTGEGAPTAEPTATLALDEDQTLVLEPRSEPAGRPAKNLRWYYVIFPVLGVAVGLWFAFVRERGPSQEDRDRAQQLVEEAAALMTGSTPDLTRARTGLHEATKLDPKNARAWNGLGATYLTEDPAEAEQCFHRSVALDDAYAQPWDNLAQISMDRGDYEEALVRVQNALIIDSTLGPALVRLGDIHAELGQTEEAEAAYRQASLSPGVHVMAENNWGALLVGEERCEEALSHLRPVWDRLRNEPAVMKNYGLALLCKGDLDEAQRVLEQVPSTSRHYPAAQDGLAEIADKRSGEN